MSKSKGRNRAAAIPAVDESPPPALNKQSRYSCEPWKPGELPAGMIFTTRPAGQNVAPYPWCRPDNGVQKPTARGDRGPEKT